EIILSSTTGQLVTILSFLVIVPATMVFFLYNIVLEYYFSATVGKKLFRLVTVDHSGLKMQGRQVIIRNLSKIVLGEFLILDTVLGMILERQTPERTHYQRGLDILAETIVIKV
ncbi:MAG: RDD family protein, partial [Candidatus Hodarchaeales archaeon]